MMTVIPEGGLCNRMRAVASAARLAQLNSKELEIQWHRTPDLNCAFGELFDASAFPFSVRENNATGAWNALTKLSWLLKERMLPLAGVAVSGSQESVRFLAQPELRQAPLRARRWHVRSYAKLVDGPDLFAVLRPVPALQKAIDAYRDRLARSVAVHIRRTDNEQSTRRSPLSAFIDLMHAESDVDPATSFYVATDSPETYTQLQQEFGDVVFSHAKTSLRRDDPQAIREAVIDLFSLAGCRSLIGSYWSSFSETAWELRGIPHVVVDVA